MIDPFNITKSGRDFNESFEFLVFCLLVSGKRADTTVRSLEKIKQALSLLYTNSNNGLYSLFLTHDYQAIDINDPDKNVWENVLINAGVGCFRSKARGLSFLVKNFDDLYTYYNKYIDFAIKLKGQYDESFYIKAFRMDLIKCPGIGLKTASYFLVHSYPQLIKDIAVIDRHILSFLKDNGVANVPQTTPQSISKYIELEKEFIKLVPKNKSIAQFDLEVWSLYTKSKKEVV